MKVWEPLAVAGSGAQAEYQTPYGLPTPTVICHRRSSAPTGVYVGAGRAIVRVKAWMQGVRAIIDRLRLPARVVLVIFIFLIVAALIFDFEITSWEGLLALVE
jgi:hypothetical protein